MKLFTRALIVTTCLVSTTPSVVYALDNEVATRRVAPLRPAYMPAEQEVDEYTKNVVQRAVVGLEEIFGPGDQSSPSVISRFLYSLRQKVFPGSESPVIPAVPKTVMPGQEPEPITHLVRRVLGKLEALFGVGQEDSPSFFSRFIFNIKRKLLAEEEEERSSSSRRNAEKSIPQDQKRDREEREERRIEVGVSVSKREEEERLKTKLITQQLSTEKGKTRKLEDSLRVEKKARIAAELKDKENARALQKVRAAHASEVQALIARSQAKRLPLADKEAQQLPVAQVVNLEPLYREMMDRQGALFQQFSREMAEQRNGFLGAMDGMRVGFQQTLGALTKQIEQHPIAMAEQRHEMLRAMAEQGAMFQQALRQTLEARPPAPQPYPVNVEPLQQELARQGLLIQQGLEEMRARRSPEPAILPVPAPAPENTHDEAIEDHKIAIRALTAQLGNVERMAHSDQMRAMQENYQLWEENNFFREMLGPDSMQLFSPELSTSTEEPGAQVEGSTETTEEQVEGGSPHVAHAPAVYVPPSVPAEGFSETSEATYDPNVYSPPYIPQTEEGEDRAWGMGDTSPDVAPVYVAASPSSSPEGVPAEQSGENPLATALREAAEQQEEPGSSATAVSSQSTPRADSSWMLVSPLESARATPAELSDPELEDTPPPAYESLTATPSRTTPTSVAAAAAPAPAPAEEWQSKLEQLHAQLTERVMATHQTFLAQAAQQTQAQQQAQVYKTERERLEAAANSWYTYIPGYTWTAGHVEIMRQLEAVRALEGKANGNLAPAAAAAPAAVAAGSYEKLPGCASHGKSYTRECTHCSAVLNLKDALIRQNQPLIEQHFFEAYVLVQSGALRQ